MDGEWEALFTEVDNFLVSLRTNKEYADKRFIEYAIERLAVCITCVARIKDLLCSVSVDMMNPEESSIVISYCSHFEELIEYLRLISIEWQKYLDDYRVREVRSAYSTSIMSSVGDRERGRPKFDITQEQLEYLSSMSFNWSQVARLLGVSRTTVYRRRIELGRLASNVTDDQLREIIRDIRRNYPSLGESLARGMLVYIYGQAGEGFV